MEYRYDTFTDKRTGETRFCYRFNGRLYTTTYFGGKPMTTEAEVKAEVDLRRAFDALRNAL